MLSITSAQLTAWLTTLLWPLVRIMALLATAPVIGNPSLPARVKVGLGMLITILVAPLLPPLPAIDLTSGEGMMVLAQQILIGSAMGFVMHLVFHAAEMAGELIGLQMGLGFATLYDPSVPGMIPVVGRYMGIVVTLAFLAVDGHLLLLSTLVESFQLLPIGPQTNAAGFQQLVRWAGCIFSFGVALALPLLGALLLTNIALAVLTRAAPQLNIFVVGFPLTILIGLLVLYLALPYLAPGIENLFLEGLQTMVRITGALAP